MKQLVPIVLEQHVSNAFVRRCAQHCFRFMDGYRIGLQGPELDYAMKKYSAKRRIPLELVPQIRVDFQAFKERLAVSKIAK